MRKLISWELDDGEAVHDEAPDTFWIPPRDRRESLKRGEIVKLMFRMLLRNTDTGDEEVHVERMWVDVVEARAGGYRGVLDNDPYCTKELASGAEVLFEPRHVIQIYEERPKN